MKAIVRVVVSAAVAFGIVATATASHNAPRAARALKSSLVKSYARCDPNATDTVTSTGLPACEPVVPTDPTCDFGPKGTGTATASVLTGPSHDIQLKVSLVGLDSNCAGKTLTGVVTVRVTVDDCAGDACTLPDFVDFPVGSCTVGPTGGCKFKGTVNTVSPGLLLTGHKTEVEILDCAVKNGLDRTFSCGLLVP